MKKIIVTTKAPSAIGPYSQAVEIDGFIYCSGQIPLDPKTGSIVGNDIKEQTKRVMENIKGLLEEVNLTFEHVIKTTIFLTDIEDFQKVNEVYGNYFLNNPPARSCVEVSGLPKGAKIEIECIVKTTY